MFQALRAIARKSWEQKMPVAKCNGAAVFLCWSPLCGSMELIPLSSKQSCLRFLFQALRALARKSWEQKMPVAKWNGAAAFLCWFPLRGSMKLIPLSPQGLRNLPVLIEILSIKVSLLSGKNKKFKNILLKSIVNDFIS